MAIGIDMGTIPPASSQEILQALVAVGVFDRPLNDLEQAREERALGGPDLLRLGLAHMLAGAAEREVIASVVAADAAGHSPKDIIAAGRMLYDGTSLDRSDEDDTRLVVLRAMASRLENALLMLVAEGKNDDDRELSPLTIPAAGATGTVREMLKYAVAGPAEDQSESIAAAATELRQWADQLDELAEVYRTAASG
ncbi:hypothetical protein ABZ829_27700 [Streptomyces xanthochromogenes]|uniref:hypothetical protein n=1 Tax=Streptomyces xanthochromogenes TaxID=67384 RepID=UPI00343CE819